MTGAELEKSCPMHCQEVMDITPQVIRLGWYFDYYQIAITLPSSDTVVVCKDKTFPLFFDSEEEGITEEMLISGTFIIQFQCGCHVQIDFNNIIDAPFPCIKKNDTDSYELTGPTIKQMILSHFIPEIGLNATALHSIDRQLAENHSDFRIKSYLDKKWLEQNLTLNVTDFDHVGYDEFLNYFGDFHDTGIFSIQFIWMCLLTIAVLFLLVRSGTGGAAVTMISQIPRASASNFLHEIQHSDWFSRLNLTTYKWYILVFAASTLILTIICLCGIGIFVCWKRMKARRTTPRVTKPVVRVVDKRPSEPGPPPYSPRRPIYPTLPIHHVQVRHNALLDDI